MALPLLRADSDDSEEAMRLGYKLMSEEVGYDELILHQIGPDQVGFFEFFHDELGPALRERGSEHAPRAHER